MHAKMTRDRKKVFITSVEKTISELEEDNKRMRDIISKQALNESAVTPETSPMMTFNGSPDLKSMPSLKALDQLSIESAIKRSTNNSLDSFVGSLTIVG